MLERMKKDSLVLEILKGIKFSGIDIESIFKSAQNK